MGRKKLKQLVSVLLLFTLIFNLEPVTSWALGDVVGGTTNSESFIESNTSTVNVVAGGSSAPINDKAQGFRIYAIDVKYSGLTKDDSTLYNEGQIVSRK